MNLNEWASKWNIPFDAVEDLSVQMGSVDHDTPSLEAGVSEAAVASRVRLEAGRKGIWLMRNNVGAAKLENGRVLRYGLANVSKQQNSVLKSSDLIGIKPVTITQYMVGGTIGQFIARETKPEHWQYSGNTHEQAQLAFLNRAIGLGADACFANKEGTL